jgi:asparagine synthase (glutamine-hydrolysing)
MCGIVGYWARAGETAELRRGLWQAVRVLSHRGPDGVGTWHDGKEIGLGHARLAILDLSQAGAQPMIARDAEVTIVFNGEVYNFQEIATELTAKGHSLVTHSDTEVVLAAYREWGPDCVGRFIGMFAFAIWDGKSKCLKLCRDRVGVKPLYYGWDGQVLCFASELKALRALPHWTVEIDQTAIGEFLQYGYIAAPRTIYRQIFKLPPGHWLHLEAAGEPRIAPYWSLAEVLERGELRGTEAELEAELEDLLKSSCRYRMVSDVPVGLFLSGGIDSSLVASLLAASGVNLEAFTIGFETAALDESSWAAKVAANLGLKHRRILDQWPSLYDEPFGDHSGIPTYLVARLAREHVKVALSADGGDELFCGYGGYPEIGSRMEIYSRLPPGFRSSAGKILERAMSLAPLHLSGAMVPRLHAAMGNGLVFDRLQKLTGFFAATSAHDAIRPFRSFFQPAEVGGLLSIPYRDPRGMRVAWPGKPMEQLAAADFQDYLPDGVLVKVDRATMCVGLEGREPLLDHRVVEFAYRLPLNLRYGPLGNKHILRSILYRHVPRALVDRAKQGFAVPIYDWMDDLLSRGAVADSLDIVHEKMPMLDIRWLKGEFRTFSGSRQGKNRLWLLHVLGQWAQKWM